jgi:hypothetical protein
VSTEYEARFTRIESTLELLAKAQLRGEYALTGAEEHMARSHKQLRTAQVLMVGELAKLVPAQTRSVSEIDLVGLDSQRQIDHEMS